MLIRLGKAGSVTRDFGGGYQTWLFKPCTLTAEAIKADGLEIAGWVANRINPGTEHYAELIEVLEKRLGAPKLGEIPYVPGAKRRELGKYINVDALVGSAEREKETA